MSKVAVMTDSNSGITQAEAKELGVSVLPMPFTLMSRHIMKILILHRRNSTRNSKVIVR